jgi:hypothetical protein
VKRKAEEDWPAMRDATNAQDKFLLLNIAYAWLKLGDQIEQLRASDSRSADGDRLGGTGNKPDDLSSGDSLTPA